LLVGQYFKAKRRNASALPDEGVGQSPIGSKGHHVEVVDSPCLFVVSRPSVLGYLVSPSYDERDLLLRRITDSAISSGRPAFYISADIGRTQDLLARYQRGFYAFSPQAARIEPKPPNLYQLPSIDNLSDHTLSLSLAIRDARAKETTGKMLLVLDTLSNIILRHKTLTTTRWLTDFVGKRKAEGFTIVATLNPFNQIHSTSQRRKCRLWSTSLMASSKSSRRN
jgi:hypothetical protein